MQGLAAAAVSATLVASLGVPAVALRGLQDPALAQREALLQTEECTTYETRIGLYRTRLMTPYADPADKAREQALLMFYERMHGQHCRLAAAQP